MISPLPALLLLALSQQAQAAPRPILAPDGPTWPGPLPPDAPALHLQGRDQVYVDARTGALWVERQDVALPGAGPALEIRRVWLDGAWRWSIDTRLSWDDEGVTLHLLDGDLRAEHVSGATPGADGVWPEGAIFRAEGAEVLRMGSSWRALREDPRDGEVTEIYEDSGAWRSREDAYRNRIQAVWEDGQLARIAADDGRALELQRELGGPVTAVFAGSLERTYERRDGQLIAVGVGEGGRTRYTYDDDGRLRGLLWPDRSRSLVSWTDEDRVRAIDGPGPLRYSFRWEPGGVVARDAAGGALRLRSLGEEARQIEDVTGPDGRSVRSTWEGERLLSWEDPGGRPWRLARGDDGQVASLQAPGGDWRFERSAGALVRVTDPSGRPWSYERNLQGDAVAIVDPTGRRREFERDGQGRVRAIRRGVDLIRLLRDAAGQLIGVEAGGARTSIHRDAAGRIVKLVDPGDQPIRLSARAGTSQIVTRGGGTWSVRYDEMGRPTRIEDPRSGVLLIRRSALGAPTWIGAPGGEGVRIRYGADGRPARILSPSGAAVGLLYDRAGRLSAVRAPDLSELRLRRDAWGRTAAITRSGETVEIDRDLRGRPLSAGPLSWTWDAAGAWAGVETGALELALRRDAGGAVTRWTLGGEATRVSRDAAGRAVALTDDRERVSLRRGPGGLIEAIVSESSEVKIERDVRGLPSRVTADERTRLALRDAPGRVVRWTSAGGVAISGEWDALGDPSRVRYPDGTMAVLKHLPEARTLEIRDPDGEPWIQQELLLDERGRARQFTEGGEVVVVRRDPSSALVALESLGGSAWAWMPGVLAGTGDGTEVFFDESGRPIRARPPVGPLAWGIASEALTYAFDTAGRMAAVSGDGLVAGLSHDPLGRLTDVALDGGAGWSVRWDLWGRPAEIQTPDGASLEPIWGLDALLAWRSPDGDADVLHEPGWGWTLDAAPETNRGATVSLVADLLGSPRLEVGALPREEIVPIGWTPTGFPDFIWPGPIGWMGLLPLASGGPFLGPGGAWDPVSGAPTAARWSPPWAQGATARSPVADWPALDGWSEPAWSPEPWTASEDPWSDPLALLVALGELEDPFPETWVSAWPEPPPAPWMPRAAATPPPPLGPGYGEIPLEGSDLLAAAALRATLRPTEPLSIDALIGALLGPDLALFPEAGFMWSAEDPDLPLRLLPAWNISRGLW